ncbi:hypothetical protein T4D_4850 [Trichinella pseudospiralis]|uniref:Uncharacterized protein n=1 Tax=Trichinella pseudospiralis TaxID=6337 RepID=A0A0V1F7K6_TRIPS|nr:hypothetical protein T4D_4850 [Trichinella pseudospiralis]
MHSICEKRFPPLQTSRQLLQITLTSVLIFHTKENLRIWIGLNKTFKAAPEWYSCNYSALYNQIPQLTHFCPRAHVALLIMIICEFETTFIPKVQELSQGIVHVKGSYFHFCQAVLRKVGKMKSIHESKIKK